MDALILNTLVLDVRGPDYGFVDDLVGPGGLAKCPTTDMPNFSQEHIRQCVEAGRATAGGPGNTAPLMAHAGLTVAVGGFVGAGAYDGLDVQGRTIRDILATNGVDTSALLTHPTLPTGTTFIHDTPSGERGGIAYFPNANDDFDFEQFKLHVARLRPAVVYYMYSGLSRRGDANEGRDLAGFMAWCRSQGCLTMADSHTLCAAPKTLIASGTPVDAYRLLDPLLPELDVFFCSWDEARMIRNTLDVSATSSANRKTNPDDFLCWLTSRYGTDRRARLFGVTVKDGAWVLAVSPGGRAGQPQRIVSPFMSETVTDLVGAGDSFRAGLIGYMARHVQAFRKGRFDVAEAVQVGNLMASLFLSAPLEDRYSKIMDMNAMIEIVSNESCHSLHNKA